MSTKLLSSEYSAHGTPSPIVEAARRVMGGLQWDFASSHEANRRIGADQILTREDNALLRPWRAESALINPPGGTWTPKDQAEAIASIKEDLDLASGKKAVELRQKLRVAERLQAERAIVIEQYVQVRELPWYKAAKTNSISGTFAAKTLHEYREGNLKQAIFVVFNAASASQIEDLCYGEFPLCWTVKSAARRSPEVINNLGRVRYIGEDGQPGRSPTQPSAIVYLPRRGRGAAFEAQAVCRFYKEFSQFGRCGIFSQILEVAI